MPQAIGWCVICGSISM